MSFFFCNLALICNELDYYIEESKNQIRENIPDETDPTVKHNGP